MWQGLVKALTVFKSPMKRPPIRILFWSYFPGTALSHWAASFMVRVFIFVFLIFVFFVPILVIVLPQCRISSWNLSLILWLHNWVHWEFRLLIWILLLCLQRMNLLFTCWHQWILWLAYLGNLDVHFYRMKIRCSLHLQRIKKAIRLKWVQIAYLVFKINYEGRCLKSLLLEVDCWLLSWVLLFTHIPFLLILYSTYNFINL